MDIIGVQDLWSFQDNGNEAVVVDCIQVRQSQGHEVSDYLELAGKIAELQFRNRDYVLLYRGQLRDHRSHNGQSTLQPTIFRMPPGTHSLDRLPIRFDSLEAAECSLVDRFQRLGFIGLDELTRHRILRWSILQHYEVHPTPLLDVTQSLRIAASFASIGNETEEAFLYVLGVPNISGAISASAEAGLQIVRLSSVCPPSAIRPHVQEGYLVGEYPEIGSYDQKQLYGLPEIDFGKRLVAKFRFNPQKFWSKSGQFQMIGPRALYPSPSQDRLNAVAKEIIAALR
jgi:hypothetical protein